MMSRKSKNAYLKKDLIYSIPIFLMMLPGLVYLFINNYIPMAGLVIAFKKYNAKLGMFHSEWNGLSNFKFLFSSGDVGIILRNTLLYNVAFIILNLVIGVALAIVITEVYSKTARKVYQSAILIPFLISMVIVGYIVYAFLSGDN